jgi:hypothetical protein
VFGQYGRVDGPAAGKTTSVRVIVVLATLTLVAAGAIVALMTLPGPTTQESDHVPALRQLLDEIRPASATLVDTADQNQCASRDNWADETLQTSFDLSTMEGLYRPALTARSWQVQKAFGGGLVAHKRYSWGKAAFSLTPHGFGSFDVQASYSCDTND